MSVFGLQAWWQRWCATADAGPPSTAPRASSDDTAPSGDNTERASVTLDDSTLKAYAMQRPEWAEALIQVESARVAGQVRLLSVRLLLGTACGSLLLLSIAIAARVAPSVSSASSTPLTTAIAGAVSATVLTALGAGLGRVLRSRPAGAAAPSVSDGASAGDERQPRRHSESGDA